MSTEEKTPTTTKPAKVTLRPKQWAIAEAMWRKGEGTAEELAKRFGVHRSTILRHMAAKGITQGEAAEETRRKVAATVEATIDDDAAIQSQRIRETKDDHYKMASGLSKLAWNEILKAKAEGVPLAAATSNLKAIDIAMTVLAKARIERWAILGLDRPDAVDTTTLPDLVIKELTAKQIEELQARSFNPYDEGDLKPDDDAPAARDPLAPEQEEEGLSAEEQEAAE